MPVVATRFSGRTFRARELTLIREIVQDCSGLSRMELGAHGVRVVAVATPERGAQGAGVPGVPRAARRARCAGPARQAPGARGRLGDPRPPDRGGRAGAPTRRQRARCGARAGRTGAGARPAAAVPKAGWALLSSQPAQRSRAAMRQGRRGAQDHLGLSCGPGCAAVVAGALSDACRMPCPPIAAPYAEAAFAEATAASRSFDEALFDLARTTGAKVPKRQAARPGSCGLARRKTGLGEHRKGAVGGDRGGGAGSRAPGP